MAFGLMSSFSRRATAQLPMTTLSDGVDSQSSFGVAPRWNEHSGEKNRVGRLPLGLSWPPTSLAAATIYPALRFSQFPTRMGLAVMVCRAPE
jgi:hypothetical protein